MIKLPNLDDQRYDDIVEAAKRRIPVIYPTWTDLNEHDPGVTLIELFAWLKEMQQYYLNRLSDGSYENMLRLLGVEIGKAVPARAEIRFKDAPEHIIKGAEARLEDGTVFVSETAFKKAPFTLGRIYIESPDAVHDVTELAFDSTTDFYPFSSQRGTDERYLYIGFFVDDESRFAEGAELVFDIPDKYPVARNPAAVGGRSPRTVEWEYSTVDGFKPCLSVEDDTLALSFSGGLKLYCGTELADTDNGGKLPMGKYFRARLVRSGCEDMPAISAVYTDRLILTQKKREADFIELTLEASTLTLRDKLLCDGLSYVLVRDKKGWRYAENAVVTNTDGATVIELADCGITAAEDGMPNVRVVFANEHFGRTRMFFSSDGLPGQSLSFDLGDEVLTDTLRVMAAQTDDEGELVWQDYEYMDSLALAGPYDRAFTYDRDRRTLVFGDNENGEVPSRGDDTVMVISCACTKGGHGNIRRGNLSLLNGVNETFGIVQHRDAEGGQDRETLSQAMDRMKLQLNKCTRAITAEDYRTIALKTPGLRIADAKAIAHFDPDIPGASKEKLINTVTVAVLPYSSDKYPFPDESFLSAVKEHIENYRMITTYVKVVAPIYVKVDISAEVVCGVSETPEVRRRVSEAIGGMFSVYGVPGTKFGEHVSDTEVLTVINAVDGILSVKHLQISTDDSRCYRDKYGRIMIPPHAIACLGRINIEVTEP